MMHETTAFYRHHGFPQFKQSKLYLEIYKYVTNRPQQHEKHH